MNNKKAVCLISTGIDSPVAAHLMIKQGFELIFVHMKTSSVDDTTIKKLIEVVSKGSKLIIHDYIPTLNKIKQNANTRFTCLLCKRGMYKIAAKIAKEEGATCIVTGENLGQVASQTLENMNTIDSSVNMPVLRPLLCLDKIETIEIAKRIGTLDLSIIDNKKCAFVPSSPATKSKIFVVEREEKRLESI